MELYVLFHPPAVLFPEPEPNVFISLDKRLSVSSNGLAYGGEENYLLLPGIEPDVSTPYLLPL
jgi:hypothetical protein